MNKNQPKLVYKLWCESGATSMSVFKQIFQSRIKNLHGKTPCAVRHILVTLDILLFSPSLLRLNNSVQRFLKMSVLVACHKDMLHFKNVPSLCLWPTYRYSSDTSPIGALSLLPSVSWSCRFHRAPPGLDHATVSTIYSSPHYHRKELPNSTLNHGALVADFN